VKPEIRHLPPAKTWCERLHRNRFGFMRHLVQVLVLLAFVGTARWGWTFAGEKLLSGDLSSSLVLGTIPLSDPLALLERLFAGHLPQGAALLGSVIVFVLYAVLGSRTFCGWVCPMNLVADLADALRRALGLDADLVRLSKSVRYASLLTALLASAATGVAAFEAVSPQAFLWRDVVWGTGLGALSASESSRSTLRSCVTVGADTSAPWAPSGRSSENSSAASSDAASSGSRLRRINARTAATVFASVPNRKSFVLKNWKRRAASRRASA